uniref:Uncharacterized protein n=1 Tax=viral metagenome TaxID=1070528 RepID=A0A6C0BPV8_9ZZZZ
MTMVQGAVGTGEGGDRIRKTVRDQRCGTNILDCHGVLC